VALKVQLATGDLHALIDAAKIRQVLINLVQNAADAMDGSGTIVLRASGFPEGEGVGTILAVEDDGPGIPTEHQARIFEPFYTTKFSGTGLGLSIARSMVEQHGGSLEFDSEPGTGTTFYLLLPGADPASANAPEAELSKEA
jgi:signal transduction histidine kinase